eukprot:gene31346-6501_t
MGKYSSVLLQLLVRVRNATAISVPSGIRTTRLASKDGTGSIHTLLHGYQEAQGLTFSSFCTAFNSWLHTAHARLQLSCYRQQIEARAAQPSSSNGGQQILFGPPPPPPVVAYPPLDESNSQLLPNYAIEVFIKAVQPRIEEHHLCRPPLPPRSQRQMPISSLRTGHDHTD